MEFKGTKGKWVLDPEFRKNEHGVSFLSIDFDDSIECIDIYTDSRLDDSDKYIKTAADALLISKAPEMLKMLIKIHGITTDEDIKYQVELLIKEATEL